MSYRSVYQLALIILALLTAIGAVWLVLGPFSSPGLEVHVPVQTGAAPLTPSVSESAGTSVSRLINLNTATADELEALPTIGEVLAQRIVDHRETHGPFQRVDQIMAVERVGFTTYQAVRHLVTIGE